MPFQNTLWQSTCESVPNTCKVSMRAVLSGSFIILRELDLSNVSPSVRWNFSGFFLTDWLPMASILFKIVRIWNSQFKCNYHKNEKVFLNFLSHFLNQHEILKILKKRMIVIANVFPKLKTVKILVRRLSKKRCFRTRFESQHVKASQIHAKSPWRQFCHVVSLFSGKLIRI